MSHSALSETMTLEAWRLIAGLNPWAFWGWDCSACGCNSSTHGKKCKIWDEYSHQNGRLGRDDIRQAILEAETKIRNYTHVPVGRNWFEETRPLTTQQIRQDCLYPAIQLCNNHVIELGVPQLDVIAANEAVTLSKIDGTAVNAGEKPYFFTLTIGPAAIPSLDADEYQVHFSAANRLGGGSTSNRYRIDAEITVTGTLAAGSITITGKAWQLADPLLHEDLDLCPLDPTVLTNYVTTLDIYRLHTNTEGQTVTDAHAELITENEPCACGCKTTISDPAATSSAIGRGGVRHGKTGLVYIAEATHDGTAFNEVCPECGRDLPVHAKVRYMAGVNKSEACSGNWDRTVAKLAAGILPDICQDCRVDENFLGRYSLDLSLVPGDETQDRFTATFEQLNNIFGPTRGAIEAAQEIKTLKVQRALAF